MRRTLVIVWSVVVVCFLPARPAFAQQQAGVEQAVRAVLETTAKAFWAGDFDTYQSNWAHDPDVTRTLISSSDYTVQKGWAEIASQIQNMLKAGPPPKVKQQSINNFIVRSAGDMAAIEFDLVLTFAEGGPERHTREQRVLMKKDNAWKFVSQVSIESDSYGDTPAAIEASLNADGYRLLTAGNVDHAIEVFKLNVQLYPNSWNAYDSLGEAYAKAGNKPLAIQNYEKSIQLNPKNEEGKAALAKLKGK